MDDVERPPPIARLATLLGATGLVHELIFERHRKLIAYRPNGPSSELLAESARIATAGLPGVLAEALELQRRWSEQSVLDPSAAEATLKELVAVLERSEPEAKALLERQRQIAEELRLLLEEADG